MDCRRHQDYSVGISVLKLDRVRKINDWCEIACEWHGVWYTCVVGEGSHSSSLKRDAVEDSALGYK